MTALARIDQAEPLHDRDWWFFESERCTTDWPGCAEAALGLMMVTGIVGLELMEAFNGR
jgi:hypothetical protein